jgi:solute carrier family 25 carnitine/acylcarnitine transporter 20/29
MALVLVGHPFDSIKTRLQIEGTHGRFKGPLHCVQETFRGEGVCVRPTLSSAPVFGSYCGVTASQLRGFYKGLSPPLLATGIVNSVLFGLQGLTLHYMVGEREAPHTRFALLS